MGEIFFTPKQIEQKYDEIIRFAKDNNDIERVFLFGSRAYGNPREDSDIDLFLVISDQSVKSKSDLYEDYYHQLTQTNHVPIDIIVQKRTSFEERSKYATLDRKVLREGRVLYDKH